MRAEVDDDDEALRRDDVNSDDEARGVWRPTGRERQPLRPGDLLEIDGRVRNSKVIVTYATGATTHVKGEGSFKDDASTAGHPGLTPFPDDASDRTLRNCASCRGRRGSPLWGLWRGGRRRRYDDDETEIIRDRGRRRRRRRTEDGRHGWRRRRG